MSKGRVLPAESRWLADPATGRRIRQVTSHPSIHHHPFFFVPPWDDAMRRLVFVSHRAGTPQLYAEEDGRFVQLTDRLGASTDGNPAGRLLIHCARGQRADSDSATRGTSRCSSTGSVSIWRPWVGASDNSWPGACGMASPLPVATFWGEPPLFSVR